MSTASVPDAKAFRLGVNYWPARTAMGWWRSFDVPEVAEDFTRIKVGGFDSVRIFLTWEDFQPTPTEVSSIMRDRLVTTLDLAGAAGLAVMPTLFTGHMSGVNWIPPWALGENPGDARFRVLAQGAVVEPNLANWYADPAIVSAQSKLARQLAASIAGHSALWAWDLGNENSNCTLPPSKQLAREWLLRMTDAIRNADPGAKVTLGLHMEDLEQDRNLGPREAAAACDFLTMHGYPGYASWAEGPTDARLVPFLTRVTRWLAGGADVLFSEFGVPTKPPSVGVTPALQLASAPALVAEDEAAAYVERALGGLHGCGSTGAMLWCYSDYAKAIWDKPPLDLAFHERSFGLWCADGSPKPAVAAIQAFAARRAARSANSELADSCWLDLDAADFYQAPAANLQRLYRRYCDASRALS